MGFLSVENGEILSAIRVQERHLKTQGDNMEAKWRKANERFIFVTGGKKERVVGRERNQRQESSCSLLSLLFEEISEDLCGEGSGDRRSNMEARQ